MQPSAGLYVELRALVAKFSQDMDGAVKTVLGAEKRISGAFNTINKVAQAALVIGGVTAVYKMSQAVGALAEKGDKLSDLSENFRKLGGSAEQIQAAKNAVLGTVSSMDLMRIANEGMLKQVPGIKDNFALMAEYAGRFAEATGTDAKDALERLTGAFATGSVKQLQAAGIVIDTTKAYQDYGNKIGITADKLDAAQKKEARQLEALNQLLEAKKKLLPMEDSLAEAQAAVGVAMDEATAKFGSALNSNTELTKAYRDFADAMDDIDWAALGKAAAEFFATMLGWAQAVLPKIAKWTEDAARGFNYLFGSGTQAEADRTAEKIQNLEGELAKLEERRSKMPQGVTLFGQKLGAGLDEEAAKLNAALQEETSKFMKLKEQLDKNAQAGAKLGAENAKLTVTVEGLNNVTVPGIKHTQLGAQALAAQAKEAEKAAREIEKFKEKWEQTIQDGREDSLKGQIEKAIETLNRADFEKLKRKMQSTVKEGFLKEWEEAIKKGAVSFEQVEREGERMAQEVGAELEDKMTEAGKRAAEVMRQEFSKAFDQMSQGLAAIGEAFGVDLSGVSNAFNRYLTENAKSETVQSIANTFGYDTSTAAGQQEAAADIGGYTDAAGQLAGYYSNSKELDSETNSNAGSGAAAGATVGAVVGAYFGGGAGAALGAQVGGEAGQMIGMMIKTGSEHAATQARHLFANFLEESFEKLKQVSFYDAQGKLKNFVGDNYNFLEGDRGRFNQPGWADSMSSWGDQAKNTFYGLGEALEEVLGITEDVGHQIGFLLGEHFSANVDNARLLVQQLGLSLEQMEEALIKVGRSGEMSWHEVEVGLQGVTEAFKPGLVAIGDMKGAMDGLIGSGGRGIAALKGVRDSAVEAMEAGAKSIDEMGQKMIQQGVDPTLVADFIEAVKNRGIKTLEELANASDRVAGGIVADVESNNEKVREQWAQMTKDLKGLAETIEKIPTEKDIKINVKTDFDENTSRLFASGYGGGGGNLDTNVDKYATGGVVEGATFFGYGNGKLGVAGEAGAEAILPLTKVGGKLGVLANLGGGSQRSVVYNIDARGASPGVEARIKYALKEVEEKAVRRAVNTVMEGSRRGARW